MSTTTRQIKMFFHCAGVTSKEDVDVVDENDRDITVDDSGVSRTFSKKSGRCINDENFAGAYRTISPIKPKKQ
jgi:hypothetical protein